MTEEGSYFDGVKLFRINPTVDEKILIECAAKVEGRTVKSAFLLIRRKLLEGHKQKSEHDPNEELMKILRPAAKRVRDFIETKEWDKAKEAVEAFKAMNTTIGIVYISVGHYPDVELINLFEETMEFFSESIASVDQKVARVFRIEEFKKR